MRKLSVMFLLSVLAAALLAEAISWSETTSLPRPSWRHACAAAGNHIYFLGGGEGPQANCDYATVNPDGTLGPWVATTAMPVNIGWFSADATRGHIYVCGGWNMSGLTSAVWYAELDSSGSVGTWRQGTSLPTALYTQGAVLVDSNLYMLGGATGVGVPTIANVRYARIRPDGSIGSWTETSMLPEPLRIMGVAVKDTWLYSVGGRNEPGSAVSSVYFARIHPDGSLSPWTSTTSLPQPSDGLTCAAVGDRVYAVGGWGAGPLSSVYSAQVNPDGSLGNWVTETPLPGQRWASDGLAVNGRLYVPGGYLSSPQAEVYYSSALTSIAEQQSVSRSAPSAVFPNPARGGKVRLIVYGEAARYPTGSVSVSICDAAGRVVLSQAVNIERNGPSAQLDIRGLSAGVYLVRMSADRAVVTQQVVVME
ncbi:MAG: T9SS type A sorting domain-containing protein [candidate division WOR-3 bacterium]